MGFWEDFAKVPIIGQAWYAGGQALYGLSDVIGKEITKIQTPLPPTLPTPPALPRPGSLNMKSVTLPTGNVSIFKPDVGGLPTLITSKLPGAGTPLVTLPPAPTGLFETKVEAGSTTGFKQVAYRLTSGKTWTQVAANLWKSSTGETSRTTPPEIFGGVPDFSQAVDGSRIDLGVSVDMAKMTAKSLPAEVQSTDIISLIRRGQSVTVPQILGVSPTALGGVGEEGMILPFPDVEPIDLINAKLDPVVYNTLSSRDKNYWVNEKQKANQNLQAASSIYHHTLIEKGISISATGQYPAVGMIPVAGLDFSISGNPLESAAESARYENTLIQQALWSSAFERERGRPATAQRKDITGVPALGGQVPITLRDYTSLFTGAAAELAGRVQAVQPIAVPTLPGGVPEIPTPPSPFLQPPTLQPPSLQPPTGSDLVAIVQGGGQTLLKNVRTQTFVLQDQTTGSSQTLPANAFASVSTRKDIAQRMGVPISDFTKALA